MGLKQVGTFSFSKSTLGQAYIMSLKNGDNAIFINGAANSAYDPNMKNLDDDWEQAIRKSKLSFRC